MACGWGPRTDPWRTPVTSWCSVDTLLFSTCTTSLGPIIQAHGFSYHCYADDTALSLISTRWYNGSCMHLRLPGGHLCMDERTSPTTWQRLSLSFLIQHAAQLLVQALVISRLDYCNALLAVLPTCIIKPLQMIQNAAAWLVFCEPKKAHLTPPFISLHWLSVAARIKSKTLMLAYRTATGSAPAYFHSLMTIYIPSRSLRSASKRRLVVPSQRGTKSLSRTFSFTVPGWWNELTTLIQSAESLTI